MMKESAGFILLLSPLIIRTPFIGLGSIVFFTLFIYHNLQVLIFVLILELFLLFCSCLTLIVFLLICRLASWGHIRWMCSRLGRCGDAWSCEGSNCRSYRAYITHWGNYREYLLLANGNILLFIIIQVYSNFILARSTIYLQRPWALAIALGLNESWFHNGSPVTPCFLDLVGLCWSCISLVLIIQLLIDVLLLWRVYLVLLLRADRLYLLLRIRIR